MTSTERPLLQDHVHQWTQQCPEQEIEIGHRCFTPPVERVQLLQVGIHIMVHVRLEQEQGSEYPCTDQDDPEMDRGLLEIVHFGVRH